MPAQSRRTVREADPSTSKGSPLARARLPHGRSRTAPIPARMIAAGGNHHRIQECPGPVALPKIPSPGANLPTMAPEFLEALSG